MKRRWVPAAIVCLSLLAGCRDDRSDSNDEAGEKGGSGPNPGAAGGPIEPAAVSAHSARERTFLLDLARKALRAAVNGDRLPAPAKTDVPDRLHDHKGCFVTLNKDGRLRGCIGYIFPHGPLYEAVIANARSAALRDRRFQPVRPAELERIEIEISVLTEPKPLAYRSLDDLTERLRPGVDGVVFDAGPRHYATYLPQVWKQIPDRKQFLAQLAQKAKLNLPDWAWTPDRVKISTYQAEVFHE